MLKIMLGAVAASAIAIGTPRPATANPDLSRTLLQEEDTTTPPLAQLYWDAKALETTRAKVAREKFVNKSKKTASLLDKWIDKIRMFQRDWEQGGNLPPNPDLSYAINTLSAASRALRIAKPTESMPLICHGIKAMDRYNSSEPDSVLSKQREAETKTVNGKPGACPAPVKPKPKPKKDTTERRY